MRIDGANASNLKFEKEKMYKLSSASISHPVTPGSIPRLAMGGNKAPLWSGALGSLRAWRYTSPLLQERFVTFSDACSIIITSKQGVDSTSEWHFRPRAAEIL